MYKFFNSSKGYILKHKKPNFFLTIIATTLLLSSTLAFAGASHADSHTSEAKGDIKIGHQKVSKNISVVMGLNGFAGGNVAVLFSKEGLLVVDDMLPGFHHKLQKVLNTISECESCAKVKYLINTHWHFDHTGTNEYFGGEAVVISHKNVRELLKNKQTLKAFNIVVPATKSAGLPDITFTTSSAVHFNGEEIELIHFPKSHTSGDIVVYFKSSNVLHLGDLYFNGMFPFVDLEFGGNVKGMIKSVEAILKTYPSDTIIIPGHGKVSNMSELATFLTMLKETTKEVQSYKQNGMSLESIQEKGLNKRWDSWVWDFINTKTWISLVYNSL